VMDHPPYNTNLCPTGPTPTSRSLARFLAFL
jgi:hypothetical protein